VVLMLEAAVTSLCHKQDRLNQEAYCTHCQRHIMPFSLHVSTLTTIFQVDLG